MNTNAIDGSVFGALIYNGFINLKNSESLINDINVFPVPDGDTGTNMCSTLESGIRTAGHSKSLSEYLKKLSEGMLFGARGNSGVILSQIFKGFAQGLINKEEATTIDLINGFINGYKVAYKSVLHPVEGTILTVAKEGIEQIRLKLIRETDITNLFSNYLGSLKKVLDKTPEYLPVLRENNVIDSGGLGYYKIIEGMTKYLRGEQIIPDENVTPVSSEIKVPVQESYAFNENSEFNDGYCLEFLLQLMQSKKDVRTFNLESFISELSGMGESLVAVQDNTIVKVHIHVKNPVNVISASLKFGEFVSFKLENMQLQHNEHLAPTKIPLCIIAVAGSQELADLYKNLGCHYVILSSEKMNNSVQEFISALKLFNADHYVILPDNKNIILSAKQAVELSGKTNVTIVHTKNIAEIYYALAMDDCDSKNIEYRVKQIESGAGYITSYLMTTAVKECILNEITAEYGNKVLFSNDKLCAASNDFLECIEKGLVSADMEEKSAAVIFYNENITQNMLSELESMLNEKYPELQISFIEGNQPVYEIVIGLI